MSRYLIFKRFKNYREYYNTLGIDYNSTTKEIKDKFLRLSKIYHPDNKVTGNHLKFLAIKEAYDAIKDNPQKQQDTDPDSFYNRTTFTNQNVGPKRPPPIRREPIDMEHIQMVYRSLNREPIVEDPKFRPFEDHNYPNTDFNRFEYTRRYDPISKTWIYKKRSTSKKYDETMKRKNSVLLSCVLIGMAGLFVTSVNYNRFMKGLNSRTFKCEEDIDKNRAGMFVIRHDES